MSTQDEMRWWGAMIIAHLWVVILLLFVVITGVYPK